MVAPAQRDGKLIAHLTAERAALGKTEVMGIRRVGDHKSDKTVGSHIERAHGHEPDAAPAAPTHSYRLH